MVVASSVILSATLPTKEEAATMDDEVVILQVEPVSMIEDIPELGITKSPKISSCIIPTEHFVVESIATAQAITDTSARKITEVATTEHSTTETPKIENITTEKVTTEKVTTEQITETPTTEKVTTEQTTSSKLKSKPKSTKTTTEQTPTTTQMPVIESTEQVEYAEQDFAETEDVIVEEPTYFYNLSDSELKMFAKLIYLEAGNSSYRCQLGVASVVMNLMLAEGKSLKSCIYTPGRFSVAGRVNSSSYSDSCMNACIEVAKNGPIFPRSVKCFRNNHYFSWATPYTCIDNVYFSSY